MMLPLIAALALQVSGPALDGDGLRRLIDAHRKAPEGAQSARFSLDLPLVSDNKTDLGALQNPIGWTYNKATGFLTLDVDFGAVTPENYKSFDNQHLEKAPPLRTVFFASRLGHDPKMGRSMGVSYGLAVPTSTKAHGVNGGDLPANFTLPFIVQVRVQPFMIDATVQRLRLHIEGELRTVGGKAVLCSDNVYDGYGVNHSMFNGEVVHQERVMVMDYMCLAPAVVTRVALVRTDSSTPLHEWRRASAEPTPETAETAVVMVTDHKAPSSVLGDPTVSTVSDFPGGPGR